MHLDRRTLSLSLLASAGLAAGPLRAQTPDQLKPFPPFKIAGNLYFIGVEDTQDYLISTPAGLILINPDWEQNVHLLQDSVAKLGFKFTDIKIMLISHAHIDHCGGAALVKKLTGATYMVMDGDVDVVESGGVTDYHQDNPPKRFTPVKVDKVLHDGDTVSLGGTTLTAHLTPGHTKGCTTWTMKVEDGGKSYNVVIDGGDTIAPGLQFVNNPKYPNIIADYRRMYATLKSLPCDIFLGPHAVYYDRDGKYAKLQQHPAVNPFIDPDGYAKRIAMRESRFEQTVAKQMAAAKAQ